jgi:hypothetical protein
MGPGPKGVRHGMIEAYYGEEEAGPWSNKVALLLLQQEHSAK